MAFLMHPERRAMAGPLRRAADVFEEWGLDERVALAE